jgi:hypothetical protein
MFVRVARLEGRDLVLAELLVERFNRQMQTKRPPGLAGAKRVLMLFDRQNRRALGLTFFDSEEEMRLGDEALAAQIPDARRLPVEMYEVGLDHHF